MSVMRLVYLFCALPMGDYYFVKSWCLQFGRWYRCMGFYLRPSVDLGFELTPNGKGSPCAFNEEFQCWTEAINLL